MKTVKINGEMVGKMEAKAYNLLPQAFRYIHSPTAADNLPKGFRGWVVGNRKSQRIVITLDDIEKLKSKKGPK